MIYMFIDSIQIMNIQKNKFYSKDKRKTYSHFL